MRKTISSILAMEKMSEPTNSNLRKVMQKQKMHYSIANEGLFDFFRKKTGEDSKKKKENPTEHYEDLVAASEVSIHLYTVSVDEEIKYLQDLIKSGLPVFTKDVDRLEKSLKFIIDNHADILNKIDKLVDVAWLDSKFPVSENRRYLDFNTFTVAVHDLAKDKTWQANIGKNMDWMDWDDFIPGITVEQIAVYEKLYSLQEAIPNLDYIVPKKIADRSQTRAQLEKDDPRLKKLLDLNIELIQKCSNVIDNDRYTKLANLADKADNLTHPKMYGDGDETGTSRILIQGSYHIWMMLQGFEREFIENYTAH